MEKKRIVTTADFVAVFVCLIGNVPPEMVFVLVWGATTSSSSASSINSSSSSISGDECDDSYKNV